MKLAITIAFAAFALPAAADLCFTGKLCSGIQEEGFECEQKNGIATCEEYGPYIRQQLYDGAGVLYEDGSPRARFAADRKVRLAEDLSAFLWG